MNTGHDSCADRERLKKEAEDILWRVLPPDRQQPLGISYTATGVLVWDYSEADNAAYPQADLVRELEAAREKVCGTGSQLTDEFEYRRPTAHEVMEREYENGMVSH